MKTETLLVEARTEELPPPLLRDLANQFPDSLLAKLKAAGFADESSQRETDATGAPKLLATPRRVAALLKNIRRAAPDRLLTRRGPQVAAALDKDGQPTKALQGFLRATGKTLAELRKVAERGREYFAADLREAGGTLDDKLAAIVQETLLSLNAPRLMRWGDNEWRFIRPLRGMAMLWGTAAIDGEVMGVRSGRTTLGHRFMSEGPVEIGAAGEYEKALAGAKVVVDFGKRMQALKDGLAQKAEEFNGLVFPGNNTGKESPDEESQSMRLAPDDVIHCLNGNYRVLLKTATAMCENPKVVDGVIGDRFAELPTRCVAACMQTHQCFFPLGIDRGEDEIDPFKGDTELLPRFLAVADNAPDDFSQIVDGYNRVLKARLADVAFYLAEDQKANAEDNREKLKRIVYHEKLGSQFDRAERIRAVARAYSQMQWPDEGEREMNEEEVDRAAFICKADLPTLMVGEYPELAGYIAGICFAGDDRQIRRAAENHEGTGTGSDIGKILALANHLEKLVGFFGAGEKPTGGKDPFGLRRAAANVAAALMNSHLECGQLIDAARESFGDDAPLPHFDRDELHGYIADRLRQHPSILQTGAGAMELNALLSRPPSRFNDLAARAAALVEFGKLPKAATLIAANKRINNIFRKSEADPGKLPEVSPALFENEEERRLHAEMKTIAESASYFKAAQNFESALSALSSLAAPLDSFFDKVMVNANDKKIRANRFALLAELRALLNQVADISQLAA